MRKKIFLSIIMSCTVLLTIAQKTDKIKYEGFYKNIKVLTINPKGYNIVLSTPAAVKAVIDNAKLEPLKIKGESEGTDYPIVVYIGDPIVTPSIAEETNTTNNINVTSYIPRLTIECQSEAIVLNKQGLPIYKFTAKPSLFYTQNDGLKCPTYKEAEVALAKKIKDSDKFARENYIQGIYKAYADELNNHFGEFTKTATFRINIIESKKFDYSDFNQASADYQKATESAEINSDAINNAIAVWKKYADEYQADKKAKVNDDNIDEIYFNIAMGYLALGDGTNLKSSWQKCLSIKGNYGQENYAMQYMNAMVNNHTNSLDAAKDITTTKSFMSKERQFNNMILLSGFMNHYLTTKQGNLGVAMNYFPSNYSLVSNFSSTKSYGEEIKETYSIQYIPFGKITQLKYQVTGGIDNDKQFSLLFENNEFGVSKIIKDNDKLLFTATYDNGRLDELTYHATNTKKFIYKFDYSTPEQVIFHFTAIVDGVAKDKHSGYYLTYNDKMQITAMRLDLYGYSKAQYDDKGNLSQVGASNAADEAVTIEFNHQLDSKGNATETNTKGHTQKSTVTYFF